MARSRERQMSSCENKILHWTRWLEQEKERALKVSDVKIGLEGKSKEYWSDWFEKRVAHLEQTANAHIVPAQQELQRLMDEEPEQG